MPELQTVKLISAGLMTENSKTENILVSGTWIFFFFNSGNYFNSLPLNFEKSSQQCSTNVSYLSLMLKQQFVF